MREAPRSVDWVGWDTDAFSRASDRNQPLLLFLHARWSGACVDLEARVFGDPGVRAIVADGYTPMRVDVDLRPDIADRYGLGGWPSVLVLTPEGAILTGGRQLDPVPLVETLTRVLDAFRGKRAALLEAASARAALPWPLPAGPNREATLETLAVFVDQAARRLAGLPAPSSWFGDPTVISALLAIGLRRADERALELASRWIAACLESGVDPHTGAWFTDARSTTREGGRDRVALLGPNAAFLEALLEGSLALGHAGLREHGAVLANFLRREMSHPQGGFVHAWGPPAKPGTTQRTGGKPLPNASGTVLDARRFVDANAAAACACLSAAKVLNDRSLGELAISAIESVVLTCYERGAGLAHVLDPEPRVRGLLADQISGSAALIEAFDATGMPVYRDLAEELTRSVLRKHWVPEVAALQDHVPTLAGAGDVGLLGRLYCPLTTNCLGARVLQHLAALAEDVELAVRAQAILGSCAALSASDGPGAAHYVLAVLEAGDGPV